MKSVRTRLMITYGPYQVMKAEGKISTLRTPIPEMSGSGLRGGGVAQDLGQSIEGQRNIFRQVSK
jgi:hypothetical protein